MCGAPYLMIMTHFDFSKQPKSSWWVVMRLKSKIGLKKKKTSWVIPCLQLTLIECDQQCARQDDKIDKVLFHSWHSTLQRTDKRPQCSAIPPTSRADIDGHAQCKFQCIAFISAKVKTQPAAEIPNQQPVDYWINEHNELEISIVETTKQTNKRKENIPCWMQFC